MDKVDIIICECFTPEHQIIFFYDEEGNELTARIHLKTYKNVFKRLYTAIRYVFGYKSRFGEWDNFIVNPNDAEKLIGILQQYKKQNIGQK